MSKAVTGYMLDADGDSYDKTTAATAAIPFRPYFIAGSVQSSPKQTRGIANANQSTVNDAIQSIVFDSNWASFAFGNNPSDGNNGDLLFGVKRHAIVVSSTLRHKADVLIVNATGQTIASFDIQPGETVETPIRASGVYIIHAAGGHYTKKIVVK
jgi:hypothetical protein